MSHSSRIIKCPRCGNEVRIPWFWILGLEGIFRCQTCKTPFKTGYKVGAILSALGLSFSVAIVQLIVYVFSIYSMILAVILMIPMWIFFAFHLRKRYMIRKTIRRIERQQRNEASSSDRTTE